MRLNSLLEIPYVKLQFQLEILENTILPQTKTSALRGGMGEMLLRQNCVRDRKCDRCPFQKRCVVWDTFYSRMEQKPGYVTGKESVGYLIECRDYSTHFATGSRLDFYLTLFGDSIVFFQMYLQAFTYLGMAGLGKNHSRFRLLEVKTMAGRRLMHDNEVDMQCYQIRTLRDYVERRKDSLRQKQGNYTMLFLSPLSMKFQGEYLNRFSGEAVVKGAMRRIEMLNYYIGNEIEMPECSEFPKIAKQRIRREETHRYSSTQDARIRLPGIKGKILFETIPEECLDYLLAGEITHIGKNTSFGFGQYIMGKEKLD
ncbi:MAG: CRISPR system precrRNA processing endoribonuclease RAMP protein Cas6 [Lachnospiraceae bacterium]|nr:CRISPR system precrRNA processing endoribonuclease RAMP protein Cas6 [Lachnospiraceae bacterium]